MFLRATAELLPVEEALLRREDEQDGDIESHEGQRKTAQNRDIDFRPVSEKTRDVLIATLIAVRDPKNVIPAEVYTRS